MSERIQENANRGADQNESLVDLRQALNVNDMAA